LGLSSIIESTDYKHLGNTAFENQLFIRKKAAELAYALFEFYSNCQRDVPKAIISWQKICESPDEFDDIKKVWEHPTEYIL
jgi:hypothetical protein